MSQIPFANEMMNKILQILYKISMQKQSRNEGLQTETCISFVLFAKKYMKNISFYY